MTATRATILTHRSEMGSWVIASREPAPALRPYIALYSGYLEEDRHFGKHLQPASSKLPLILNLGPPYRIDGSRVRSQTHSSFIAGLHDGPTLVGADSQQHCIQIDLTPLGAYRILGVSMHAIANEIIELNDLLGDRFTSLLLEQLHDTPDWDARFTIVEELLTARLHKAPEIPPGVVAAWERIDQRGGHVRIGELADDLGWSGKHLIAKFREYVGVTPKMLARIRRFERAVNLFHNNGSVCLASVAQAAGYYDQAHLHRDVRKFAGITPAMFLRRRVEGLEGLVGD